MKRIQEFGVLVLALLLFTVVALPTLVDLLTDTKEKVNPNVYVIDRYSSEIPESLDIVNGDSVLGMVAYALNGDYNLIVDGILITEDSDLDYVNLSGVAGQKYKLQVTTVNGKTTILANIM